MEKEPGVSIVEQKSGLLNVPATKQEIEGIAIVSVISLVSLFCLATVLFYRLVYPEHKKK